MMHENDSSSGAPPCTHEAAFDLPCGERQCPDCGATLTVACDGDEGQCLVCSPTTENSMTHKQGRWRWVASAGGNVPNPAPTPSVSVAPEKKEAWIRLAANVVREALLKDWPTDKTMEDVIREAVLEEHGAEFPKEAEAPQMEQGMIVCAIDGTLFRYRAGCPNCPENEPRARTLLRAMIYALDSEQCDAYWRTLGMLNTLHRQMIESWPAPSDPKGTKSEAEKEDSGKRGDAA
jgi:hypothetical protein